ncbi:glycoside hydrolase family 3 N-terminal domain-containing protein [Arthrobacter sp. NyZ413]|uniref:glycoside hydrolase family 3 N-terminal domain-containing protein n=1 Tax=Arthrobacter sp. NyZ413 TaxID=3144669 RepID=UPI002C7CF813|nr:glycoside hydrolase family 3 N-terminal domain-containing protein [Arthrobacter sp.]
MGNERINKAMVPLRRSSKSTSSKIASLLLAAFMVAALAGVARSDSVDVAPTPAAGSASPAPGASHAPSTGTLPDVTVAEPLPFLRTQPPFAVPAPPHEPPPHPTPEQELAALTLEQRVGQLFMVAAKADGSDAATVGRLLDSHIGNVYLAGRSQAGVAATAGVVDRLKAAVSPGSSRGIPLYVATDQEGGAVQVLSGPGFQQIPPALAQGNADPAQLRADARTWGSQLLQAGVNMDLAPVLDTVPSPGFAPSNKPIGAFQREYGFTPSAVSGHGNAMAAGLRDAGVVPVVKHFPGMGRVSLNTDVSGNVHDTETTRTDPYLAPFKTAIDGGVRWVMVSNAYYDKIDPDHVAPFSPAIMRTMLRADAGFSGVIVSDDLCNAVQLSPWSMGDRATSFIGAGGTMVLCADPAAIPEMYGRVLQRASTDPGFRKDVDDAALTVIRVKSGK